ncbi:hypothetical protein CRM22_008119 [Opisthorchis felineus]|uniref:PIN domain-containing protein n=1 Tax=Opisthorchis felineus TaxID=147828 RepID=A0A4S2LJN6_OPIFE|nr:hypothetical protein CRM22_008119 [Opisthorchis felineus]
MLVENGKETHEPKSIMTDTQPSRSDENERTRGLLKAVSDSIKRLTSIYNSGKATKTVFSYEAYGYRLRLKEALQKLMLLSPTHARRAEEMIWRKVFYEPLHLYKVYVKNNDRADHVTDFELALKMHLTSGIGFYQSLLLQLQSEWLNSSRENLLAWLPVPFHIPTYDESIYEFDVKPVFSSFGEKMVQKCLMYIGDLFRYLLEFNESVGKPLAYAYYNAALNFDPSMGLPHNQLGILDVGRCYGLNAIFHYLHCLCARVPFEGARRNLLTVLAKNEIRYRKLFGDKPIFGLYARRPNRYRPKDFRKTITKFIFLIQCFLTQKADGFTAHHSYVFQDTLLELHLMLNLSSALTLEPDRRLDKIGLDDQSSIDDVELRGESSVFSEQLTGPIFVRLLMIALLTANLKLLEQTRATRPEEATAGDLSSTQNSSEVLVPESPTESVQSETSSDKVLGIDESPNIYGLSEPFGPLSFVLQLSELFMSHLATQLNQHLATRELRGSCTFDSSIKDLRPAHPTAPGQPTDSGKLVASEGPYNEIPDRDVNQTERQQRQTVELGNSTDSSDDAGGFVRRPIRKGSGGDSTEKDVEGTDGEEEDGEGEEEEEEEDEMDYSEEADLSADLWSSDDSSPFHSQDDVDSALSSDENGEFRSDHRLRRGRFGGGVTKRSARSGQPAEPECKVDTTDGKTHSEAVCGANVRLRRKDHRTDLLDPITEEEAPLRDRRPKAGNSADKKPIDSDTDASDTSGLASTTCRAGRREARYTNRKMNLSEPDCYNPVWHQDPTNRECIADTPIAPYDEKSSAEPEDLSAELGKRVSLISRLYLLASVKVLLDWIQTDCFGPLRLLPHQNSSPEHTVMQYVIQRWCTQLTLLLNQFYPLFEQILVNSATNSLKNSDPNDRNLVSPNNPLVQFMSDFGMHALEDSLRVPSNQNKSVQSTMALCSHSRMSSQTCPLPEDWLLRGLPSLDAAHQLIDFNQAFLTTPFTGLDEGVIRALCMISAGHHLVHHATELGIHFTFEPSRTPPFQSFIPGDKTLAHPKSAVHNLGWSTVPYHPSRRRRARYSGGTTYSRGGTRRTEFVSSRQGRARWNSKGAYKRGGHSFTKYSTRPERFEQSWNEDIPQSRRSSRRHRAVLPGEPIDGPGDVPGGSHHLPENRSRTESEERIDVSELRKQSSNSSLPVGAARDANLDGEEIACTVEGSSEFSGSHPHDDAESRKTQLMRDMARLRLLNEVDQLARQCRTRSPRTHRSTSQTDRNVSCVSTTAPDDSRSTQLADQLSYEVSQLFVSPYLVVDAFCLASHLPAVKQLVNSGSFVVIIPVAVISHLDYLKKTMATARVAIRYLEHETHSGNRFLRLQRPEEQPKEHADTLRIISARSSVASNLVELESEEDSTGDSARSASPRVVKRWLSILGCATYFTEGQVLPLWNDRFNRSLQQVSDMNYTLFPG